MKNITTLLITISFFAILFSCNMFQTEKEPDTPDIILPFSYLKPDQLGLIINRLDKKSLQIGDYYKMKRNIPESNIIYTEIDSSRNSIDRETFNLVKNQVDALLSDKIQVIALAWKNPYKVDCMSITTAFAVEFSEDKFCSTPCSQTEALEYYNKSNTLPYNDYEIRPVMMLAGDTTEDVFRMIDKALNAELSFPYGKGILMRTTDKARSVRYSDFYSTSIYYENSNIFKVKYIDNSDGSGNNYIDNTDDIMFYFTGLTSVPSLDTITFLPGAVSDHLTSFGGNLNSSGQMSIIRWIEAGASGSYGTAHEPCNYQSKFPRVSVFLKYYLKGNTLIESYWKSVQAPGEGVFVGDPLTRPFGTKVIYKNRTLTIKTTSLEPGKIYYLQEKDNKNYIEFTTVLDDISTDIPDIVEISYSPASLYNEYRLLEYEEKHEIPK